MGCVRKEGAGTTPPSRKLAVRTACMLLAVAVGATLLAPGARAAVPAAASVRPRCSPCGFPRLLALSAAVAAFFTARWAGTQDLLPAPPLLPAPGTSRALPAIPLPEGHDRAPGSLDDPFPGVPEAEVLPAPEVLVLALYHPASTGEARHFGYEVAWTGVQEIQVLGEGPDLSGLALDGELMLAAHGFTGQLSDGANPIPVASVLAALTDASRGLPMGFHGKVSVVACHAGADPIPHPASLATVEQYLKLGGVGEPCVRWITDAITRKRVVSSELMGEIRARLRQDAAGDPSPERRTEEQIMAVFTRVVEALRLDRGSVVRQLAAGLTLAGDQGIEVTGPMGQAMAFVTGAGVVLEVVAPDADPAPVLELIRDLADFHLGSGSGRARSRLLAMGVAPEGHGAGRKGRTARKLVQARPGADLVGHAVRWVEEYGPLTGFAHQALSTLDCTRAIGRPRAFLPPSERFARVVVGGPEAADAIPPGS